MDKSYRGICKTFIDYEVVMKRYTSQDQTAKLIELGFEKPKSIIYASAYQEEEGADPDVEYEYAYSIGELIEMLPQAIKFGENSLLHPLRVMPTVGCGWAISYCNEYDERNNELIDALCDMVVRLKYRGVI